MTTTDLRGALPALPADPPRSVPAPSAAPLRPGGLAPLRDRPALPPSEWNDDAAEELTFQFSEVVEAAEVHLEARLEAGRPREVDSVRIEAIYQVMQLLEGRDGYLLLRQRAADFAQAYRSQSAGAMGLLRDAAFTPAQRYALHRMTVDALEKGGDAAAAEQFANEHAASAGAALGELETSWLPGQAEGDAPSPPSGASYFQAIAMKPSVRTLFDAVVDRGGIERAESTLASMQQEWSRSVPTRTLQDIGTFVLLSRMMVVVATMVADGRRFAAPPPGGDAAAAPAGLAFKCARGMLEMASSAAAGTPLDRLMALVVATNAAAGERIRRYSLLHRMACRWPDAIWASADIRAALLQLLVKRQSRGTAPQAGAGEQLRREQLLAQQPGGRGHAA